MTGVIMIDLQKTFDTIDHNILFRMLSAIDFSNHRIGWFKSYLSNQLFPVNLENGNSNPSNFTCGAPQESILEPLLFLIYVNDMPQTVKSNDFLYVDDSCLVFQGKDVIEIEKQLNGDFTKICECFVDNTLSIHFGEDNTKSTIFASKCKIIKDSKTKNQLQKYTNKTIFIGHILRLHIR